MRYCSAFLILLLFLANCSSFSVRQSEVGSSEVLDSMVDGMEAFYNADYEQALEHLEFAAGRISEVWANTADAKKAGSLWYNEQAKRFKGEPYERMMVFYYLGLLYLFFEDYGNAQAAFKQTLIQRAMGAATKSDLESTTGDSELEDKELKGQSEESNATFQLGLLLAGLSLHYLGSTGPAGDIFSEYQKYQPLPFDRKKIPNLIVILETGLGPRKYLNSAGTTVLYARQEKSPPQVIFQLSAFEAEHSFRSLDEDIFEHASARGIRQSDLYNIKKKSVKQTTGELGVGFQEFGENLHIMSGGDSDVAALAFILAGITSQIISQNIVHKADTRYWHNLPGSIHAAFFHLPKGDYQLKLQANPPLNFSKKPFSISIDIAGSDKLKLVWLSASPR